MFRTIIQSTVRNTVLQIKHSARSDCPNQFLKLASNSKFSSNTEAADLTDKSSDMSGSLVAVDFTVYGKVQGVFFRKYTMTKAKELGLRGYCMNTPEGTVTGTLEGPAPQVKTMKTWLEKTGSPKSRISKAEFAKERALNAFSYTTFQIQK